MVYTRKLSIRAQKPLYAVDIIQINIEKSLVLLVILYCILLFYHFIMTSSKISECEYQLILAWQIAFRSMSVLLHFCPKCIVSPIFFIMKVFGSPYKLSAEISPCYVQLSLYLVIGIVAWFYAETCRNFCFHFSSDSSAALYRHFTSTNESSFR